MERKVKRDRIEHKPPDPEEHQTYKEATTVTEDEHRPVGGPPQEPGTQRPYADE